MILTGIITATAVAIVILFVLALDYWSQRHLFGRDGRYTLLSRIWGHLINTVQSSEDTCTHEDTELIAGNCTYDEAHLRDGAVVLTTYRPYYRHCTACKEIFYETRYNAVGEECFPGEPEKHTTIPHHVIDGYLNEHQGRYSP